MRHQRHKPQSPNRKRVPKLPPKDAEEKVCGLIDDAHWCNSERPPRITDVHLFGQLVKFVFLAEREAAQKDGGDAADGDSSEEASETTELVPAERDEEVSSDEEGDEEQYWKKVQKKGKNFD